MTTSPTPTPPSTPPLALVPGEFERRQDARTELRSRHAERLTRLLADRSDLRGVHALADLVDDSVRWTA